jgi:hypothetical protein
MTLKLDKLQAGAQLLTSLRIVIDNQGLKCERVSGAAVEGCIHRAIRVCQDSDNLPDRGRMSMD